MRINLESAIDIINFIITLVTFLIIMKLVFRTEHGLDQVAKYYGIATTVLLIASVIEINRYLNIFSVADSIMILKISRTFALFFFMLGGWKFISIINKES